MSRAKQGQLMAEQIYADLYSFILTQGLMPGDRVKVDDLVRQFGVSQTPVRQALTRLQSDGFLDNVHNKGFVVSPFPSKERLVETLTLRISIEAPLAAQAAEGAHADALDRIEQEFANLGEHAEIARDNLQMLMEADSIFHKTIAEMAPNKVAADVLERLHRSNSVFRLKYRRGMPQDVMEEHRSIIAAIREQSPERAFESMKTHLSNSIDRVHDAL